MSRFALRLAAALLAAIALSPSAAAGAGKIAATTENWRWVSNPRFEILTNGSERRARKILDELERFRAAIAQMMGGQAAEPEERVRVLLFDRVWDMTPYQTLTAEGKPETWDGYAVIRDAHSYFALSNESGDYVPRLILSSYAYRLIAEQFRDQPQWLITGLTDYLSAYRYVERDRRAEIGRPIPEHMQYLNASTHATVKQIIATTQDSPSFAEDVPRAIFFAKSWLLVHYLQVGSPERAGALARFARNRAQGMNDVEALEKAAGCTLVELDQELSIYQRRSLMSFATLPLDPPGLDGVDARPAETADAVYRLGEYLLALGSERRAEAQAHFAAAGRPEPAPPTQVAVRSLVPAPVAPSAARPEVAARPPAHSEQFEAARVAIAIGDFAGARAQVEAAIAASPDQAKELEPLQIELDSREADRLAARGDPEAGRRLLEARVQSTSTANRAQADAALEIFRARFDAIRIGWEYNAAISLVNAQKVEEGAAALRKFLADHPDSSYAAAARADLEKVDAYLARRRARQSSPPPPPPPPPPGA